MRGSMVILDGRTRLYLRDCALFRKQSMHLQPRTEVGDAGRGSDTSKQLHMKVNNLVEPCRAQKKRL